MFALYTVQCDGSYNPWDGVMYGPFDTKDEAKTFADKLNQDEASEYGETRPKLRWIDEGNNGASAQGFNEECFLIGKLTKDVTITEESFDDDFEDDYGSEDHGDN